MKKNYLKLAAFAIMMALTTACTNEVIVIQEGEPGNSLTLGPGEDIVRINLTNTVSTRAARPISNSVADNNINRIAFKFLESDGTEVLNINLEEVIDPETGESIEGYTVDGNVLKLNSTLENTNTINIKFSNLGVNTSYRIIAYGYNNEDEENGFPYTIEVGQKNNQGNHLLKCEGLDANTIEEIFSGATSKFIGVNQHGKFKEVPIIEMKRQVAALLVYFKDAPVFVNNKRVTKITVSTRYQGTGFYFPAALLSNSEYNGIGDNASTATNDGWVHYLTFDMAQADDYSPDDNDYESGETYKFSNNKEEGKRFLLANEMEEIEGLECQDNTLFGSCFLLPFDTYRDYYYSGSPDPSHHATLNICYWTTTAEGESLITRIPLAYKGSGSEEYDYGILCNNFYHVGKKTTTELPENEEGEPDTEKDKPTSIDEPTGWEHTAVTIDKNYEASNELFN